MEINLIVGFIIGIALGLWGGWVVCSRMMINELTAMIQENIVSLTYEVVDDQHYIYYTEDGKFAGQGATLEAAAAAFGILTKNEVIGKVIPATGVEFYIVDGKIETE
jgi:hypothetical protein